MSIRLPLQSAGSFSDDNDTGTGSALGGIAHAFLIPQDTDNIVVKMTASVSGTGVSTVLQTTDDGGSTWFDVARTSIVSNAIGQNAEWLSTPVTGIGVKTTAQAVASVGSHNYPASIYGAIGKATSIAQGAVTGLPILARQARVFNIIAGDVTSAASNSWDVTVYVNNQSTPS